MFLANDVLLKEYYSVVAYLHIIEDIWSYRSYLFWDFWDSKDFIMTP